MGDRQLCFAEALLSPRLGANERLEAIAAVIDWKPLEALASRARPPQPTGRECGVCSGSS